MKRFTGIQTRFKIYREDNDEEVTDLLGYRTEISYDIMFNVENRPDIGSGATLQEAVDNMVDISVDLSCEAPSLAVVSLMGELSNNEVELSEFLPYLRAEIQVMEDKYLEITGLKLDDLSLTGSVDNVVFEVDFGNGLATNVELKDGQVEYSEPGDKPASALDMVCFIDGEEIGSVQNFDVSYSRSIESQRGIQSYEEGERRLPDEITEGYMELSWDFDVETTKDSDVLFDKAFDSEDGSLADYSTEKNVKVEIGDEYIELSGCKVDSIGSTIGLDGEEPVVLNLFGEGREAVIDLGGE